MFVYGLAGRVNASYINALFHPVNVILAITDELISFLIF